MASPILVRYLALGLLLASPPASALADPRGIRVDGKEAADYVAEQAGKSWAVVIGIDDYRDPKIPRLKYAVADAQAVAQELERRGYQVTRLLNGQATGRAIRSELRSKLRQRVSRDDRVLVYYAGHGQDDKIEGGRTMGYLLPVDGELDDIPATGISMGVMKELADALPVKHALFLMDACYGGVAGQQARGLPKMTADYLRQITRERGRQLITAGGADQEALESPDGGHGLFTAYLLKGLQEGLADLNGDGIIPASELYTYLDSRVFTDAQMRGHRQRPEIWTLSPEKGEFVFFTTARASAGLSTGAAGGEAPRPSPPTVSAPPVKDVDVSGYDQYEALARLAEKREQAWGKVQAFAGKTGVAKEKRLAALDKFLADFPDDNPHQGEVEALKQQIQAEMQVTSAPSYSAPKQAGREITGKDGALMMLVPEGEFQYGIHNERKSLPAFYMDKYEVSTAQYAKFMGAAGAKEPQYWPTSVLVSNGEKPVVGVDWHEATAYCRHYGKRLPTEQEWEKAARGTDGRKYPWGNDEPTSRHANFNRGYDFQNYGVLVNVGSLEDGKSPYGIYDMAGNVWEWTSSDETSTNKVYRGGSWGNRFADDLRSTTRVGRTPALRDDYLGFRCAQDAS